MIEVHITHNDADAIGCAIVAAFNPYRSINSHLYFCDIGEPDRLIPELLKGPEVISWLEITDISVNEDTANLIDQYIAEHNTKVELVDHHSSNKLKRPWANIVPHTDDKPFSAAWLMFDHWRSMIQDSAGVDIRILEKYIQDVSRFDTWAWKREPIDFSEEYTSILIDQYGIHKAYEHILKNLQNGYKPFEVELEVIDAYKDRREKAIERALRRAVFCDFTEYHIAMITLEYAFSNEIMECLYLDNPDVDFVLGMYTTSRTVSFRSNKKDLNLSRLATRMFNGGGHTQAAGAKLSSEEYIKLLSRYYDLLDKKWAEEANKVTPIPNEKSHIRALVEKGGYITVSRLKEYVAKCIKPVFPNAYNIFNGLRTKKIFDMRKLMELEHDFQNESALDYVTRIKVMNYVIAHDFEYMLRNYGQFQESVTQFSIDEEELLSAAENYITLPEEG